MCDACVLGMCALPWQQETVHSRAAASPCQISFVDTVT